MGPSTGPRPASSMPRAQGGPGSFGPSSEASAASAGVERRLGGTGEKCEYEAPERRVSRCIEGGTKIFADGVSSA